MKAMKDIRILVATGLILTGIGFEGLRQIKLSGDQEASQSLGKAGELFAIYKDSTLPARRAQPKMKVAPVQIPKVATVASLDNKGVAFDIQKAIGEYQKEHGLDPASAKKKKEDDKKKKNKIQYEYVWDAKTGQWIKRKKLTESQKKMLAERRLRKSETIPQNKIATKENSYAAPLAYAPSVGGGVLPKPPVEESKFLSFEEWASILLQHPNRAETLKFVEAFRSQKVTSDIYVQIMEAMMNDPRIEMQDLGLQLASYSPSAASFKSLAHFLRDNSNNESANKAQKYLDQYSSIQHLGLLEKLMKQGDDYIVVSATKRLEVAIQKYLVSPETPNATHVSSFTRFVEILKELAQSSGDSKVHEQAQTTLAQLQNSIGKYNVAANAVD